MRWDFSAIPRSRWMLSSRVMLAGIIQYAILYPGSADLFAELTSQDPHPASTVLQTHCTECHGPETVKQGLNLSTPNTVLQGSRSGPVLIPGQPEGSLLVQLLEPDAEPHMPPKHQLSPAEIESIKDWVRSLEGSSQSKKTQKPATDWWAFRPLAKPTVPTLDHPWIRSPIDAFILDQQEQRALTPNPSADKETLLRRVTYDLIGLPPSLEQRARFLSDPNPDAYERLVNRLLASPRYGERWGRHWLDLARYADSSGFHDDIHRPHAWRYRDYVIHSLNEDKSYDRFTVEQTAGDLVPNRDPSSWIATGFSRHGPSNDNNMGDGAFKEQYRYDQLDDTISTTASVFLGLTLGCARCHDHKYDAISQEDYYQFLAYYQNATKRTVSLASLTDTKPEFTKPSTKGSPHDDRSPLAAVFTDFGRPNEPTRILWRGSVRNKGPEVSPDVPASLASDTPIPDRLALAEWITSRKNPLTWRVIANRVWAFHFGTGLVRTPSNFGQRGLPPTHPELLDYLAQRLLQHRGSLKRLHRDIVTSATYRQSSQVQPTASEQDPGNHWWTRMNKRRLESEVLRDSILTAAGNLNLTMGGPGVKPRIRPDLLSASQRNKWPKIETDGEAQWRRSVYIYVKRQLPFPMLDLFGSPSTAHSCAQRVVSQVPTQALVLLNDSFVTQQAEAFATRLTKLSLETVEERLDTANRIALGKALSEDRLQAALEFLNQQENQLRQEGVSAAAARHEALALYCQVLFNLSEFIYID